MFVSVNGDMRKLGGIKTQNLLRDEWHNKVCVISVKYSRL